MMTYQTTFGRLPIGTEFERSVWDKDPRDRRRKILVRWRCVKLTQGTFAGFYQTSSVSHSVRADHSMPVYIDASDLRLVVACMRQQVTV